MIPSPTDLARAEAKRIAMSLERELAAANAAREAAEDLRVRNTDRRISELERVEARLATVEAALLKANTLLGGGRKHQPTYVLMALRVIDAALTSSET